MATQCFRYDDRRVTELLGRVGVKTLAIESGGPRESGYIESSDGTHRGELLNVEILNTVPNAKVLIARWRWEYNTIRSAAPLAIGARPRKRAQG